MVGCLEKGRYGGIHTWQHLTHHGEARRPIVIRSEPGETATVRGWVDLEGRYTTLEFMRIDGSNTLHPGPSTGGNCRGDISQPLVLAGRRDILQYVDYYQSVGRLRGNGIGVGFWGDPDGSIIRHDRIHDVGQCDFYDHLIYLAGGRGIQIYDNWMWDDRHGWGVKLDPGPQGARIWGNVIDKAGSGFDFGNSSGGSPTADNLVYDNIVMNSVGVSNPEIGWSHRGVMVTSAGLMSSSLGNRVFNNDSFHNRGGMTEISGVSRRQLRLSGNWSARPLFAASARHDYTLISFAGRPVAGEAALKGRR
jgi:hypothetical protein